jgi:two-component system, OmpR family, response regulator QseB
VEQLMRTLLVEDDDLIGSGVDAGLRQAGFAVDWAHDGVEALFALRTMSYALVVLDLGLPRMSGNDVLAAIRQSGNDVPVIVLTAKGTVAEKVVGLEAGADDYLGKPFDLTELVARCRALVRRSHGRSTETIEYRNLRVDPLSQTVTVDGTPVLLTAKEWAMLNHLLAHLGKPQSRARLEDSLYGWHSEIESNAIEVHISNLRKKLGGDLIKTVRGFGYVMDKTS